MPRFRSPLRRATQLALASALASCALAAAEDAPPAYFPSEIGLALRSVHESHNKGPDHWNNSTVGLYALWDVAEFGPVKARALAATLRLSNFRQGAMLGAMGEYGPFFATLSVVSGYQDVTYTLAEGGAPAPSSDAVKECRNYCFWKTSRERLYVVPAIGARADLPHGWNARLTYQPKPPGPNAEFWRNRLDGRKDASLTLWAGKSF